MQSVLPHLLPDDLVSLSAAARTIPPRRGRKVHVSTLLRWGRRGKITLFECNGYRVSLTEIRAKLGVRRIKPGEKLTLRRRVK